MSELVSWEVIHSFILLIRDPNWEITHEWPGKVVSTTSVLDGGTRSWYCLEQKVIALPWPIGSCFTYCLNNSRSLWSSGWYPLTAPRQHCIKIIWNIFKVLLCLQLTNSPPSPPSPAMYCASLYNTKCAMKIHVIYHIRAPLVNRSRANTFLKSSPTYFKFAYHHVI